MRSFLGGQNCKSIGTQVEIVKLFQVPCLLLFVLVKKADCNEEAKAVRESIVGVILLQQMPHLSHLGLRIIDGFKINSQSLRGMLHYLGG